mmetsp:Transcript_27452/g.91775  ORF Transcript_27452/g.91775 Transcript_27452/m.91775 type:complete len:300 (+) Transcript_27452:151-1050(+)
MPSRAGAPPGPTAAGQPPGGPAPGGPASPQAGERRGVHPHGVHRVRVGRHVHRQRELELLARGGVHLRGSHRVQDGPDVCPRKVEREARHRVRLEGLRELPAEGLRRGPGARAGPGLQGHQEPLEHPLDAIVPVSGAHAAELLDVRPDRALHLPLQVVPVCLRGPRVHELRHLHGRAPPRAAVARRVVPGEERPPALRVGEGEAHLVRAVLLLHVGPDIAPVEGEAHRRERAVCIVGPIRAPRARIIQRPVLAPLGPREDEDRVRGQGQAAADEAGLLTTVQEVVAEEQGVLLPVPSAH